MNGVPDIGGSRAVEREAARSMEFMRAYMKDKDAHYEIKKW